MYLFSKKIQQKLFLLSILQFLSDSFYELWPLLAPWKNVYDPIISDSQLHIEMPNCQRFSS